MRVAATFILLSLVSALGLEIIVSDSRRTELSASVFSGTVTNIQHLPLLKTNVVPANAPGFPGYSPVSSLQDRGLWRAEIVVESISKQDMPLGKSAFVYYEQKPLSPIGGLSFAGRVCPGYPTIGTNMSATLWCQRVTIEGFTNVLYVSMASWVKGK